MPKVFVMSIKTSVYLALVSIFAIISNAHASLDAVNICANLGIEMTYFSGPTMCIEMGDTQHVECPIITRYSMLCERRYRCPNGKGGVSESRIISFSKASSTVTFCQIFSGMSPADICLAYLNFDITTKQLPANHARCREVPKDIADLHVEEATDPS